MGDAEEPVGAEVAPAELEAPALASADPECVAWVKAKVHLQAETLEWLPEHEETIAEFVVSTATRRLFAYMDPVTKSLAVSIAAPQIENDSPDTEVQYFLKPEKTVLTMESIAKAVQFGTVHGSPVGSLLRLMSGVFVPLCLKDQSWPDTIKKEFSGQLHRFMASLTETAWDMRGTTTLYIPSEDLDSLEAAAKQKDLVQRLESTLIHWTRQIKEVVNRQDDGEDAEDAGPLAEVRFWEMRCEDLSGIHEQLERDGVKRIVEVLGLAKSSYLAPFQKLSQLIDEGKTEAVDNLKFLTNLVEPCTTLSEASPKDIPSILPKILNVVRLIWRHSQFYNSSERMAGLLRKVRKRPPAISRLSLSLPFSLSATY